ncbi:hypothetical protein KC354_g39 [Hortaea werneckii]|nr:hypothetical protein KC354_g39 [Hortaea werneckii]
MPSEFIDVEIRELLTLRIPDLLGLEIDFDFAACFGFGGDFLQGGFVGDDEGQHAVLEGAAAEVGACDNENFRVGVGLLVQDEVLVQDRHA